MYTMGKSQRQDTRHLGPDKIQLLQLCQSQTTDWFPDDGSDLPMELDKNLSTLSSRLTAKL